MKNLWTARIKHQPDAPQDMAHEDTETVIHDADLDHLMLMLRQEYEQDMREQKVIVTIGRWT